MQPLAYTTPLEPGNFYHIYNRGNNRQNVFRLAEDYQSFLNKWREFIFPVAKTFAYNLLPNHFHAIVQIRDRPISKKDLLGTSGLCKSGTPIWVSRAFTNFFISNSRTLQNRHGYHGAVFHSPFKRKLLGDDLQFDYLTAYVHYNAIRHGLFSGAPDQCVNSSYPVLLGEEPSFLERDYMLEYFGGRDGFIAYHEGMADILGLRDDLEA